MIDFNFAKCLVSLICWNSCTELQRTIYSSNYIFCICIVFCRLPNVSKYFCPWKELGTLRLNIVNKMCHRGIKGSTMPSFYVIAVYSQMCQEVKQLLETTINEKLFPGLRRYLA